MTRVTGCGKGVYSMPWYANGAAEHRTQHEVQCLTGFFHLTMRRQGKDIFTVICNCIYFVYRFKTRLVIFTLSEDVTAKYHANV